MIRHKYHADLQHMACQVLNNFAGSAAKAMHLQKKVLAFASGMHERLGAASYVSLLNDLTLGLIADQIMGEVHNHSNLKPVDVDAGNRKLQIMASTTRVLAENADYSKEIAAAGGITSIISAMNNHKEDPYVQHSASMVLRNLADNAENQIKIREAGGIESIILVCCFS
jgi:tRNA-binding EMAP/Myf-like protein